MTTLPEDGPPGPGRRGNGLSAAEWGALVDVDPRLSAALLDSLAAEGVAAFVEPAAGVDTVSRAVSMPTRPLDRLWVDPARADQARVVVTAEIADLSALLAEDEPGATAHGLVRPVPRTAATRVLAPPQLPEPPRRRAPGSPGSPGPDPQSVDNDAMFRQIIAGFSDEPTPGVAPWPVQEDLPRAAPPAPPAPPRRTPDADRPPARRRTDPRPDGQQPGTGSSRVQPPGAGHDPQQGSSSREWDGGEPMPRSQDGPPDDLPGWLEPERVQDDGHFVPPPPPAVPRIRVRTVGAVLMLLLGLVLLFTPGLVGQVSGAGVLLIGIALTAGGAGLLVWWVRDAPDDNSGPDHGAVV